MLRRTLIAGLAAGTLLAAGCHHCCRHGHGRDRDRGPSLGDPLPPRGERIPPPDVPTTPGVFPAPSVVPDTPRSSFRIDPGVGPSPGSWVGPVPGKPDPLLQAPTAPRKTETLYGDPLPRGAPPAIDVPGEKRKYLDDPVPPAKDADAKPADPPAADRPAPAPRATVPSSAPGLPEHAAVPGRDGLATGRKPTLEGFDALKANGFRTVVYLHAPNADVAPARELAQKRSLRFVPIAVSPGTLKAAFDDFTAALADRPVYVADEDGLRAGVLWYLLFRTQDLLGDDAARVRARPLGLTDATTEEQKQFWVAVQDYLAKR